MRNYKNSFYLNANRTTLLACKKNQVPRNTATKLALNQKVQVVAPAMHKAFRLADMHTNIYEMPPGNKVSAQEHI